MRQLNLTKRLPAPAEALPLLRQLAAAHQLGLDAAAEIRLLRFIVSVATQYRGRGVEWEALVRAGWAGAVRCYAGCADPDRWVRQGISEVG